MDEALLETLQQAFIIVVLLVFFMLLMHKLIQWFRCKTSFKRIEKQIHSFKYQQDSIITSSKATYMLSINHLILYITFFIS